MPNLDNFWKRSSFGELVSSIPPMTPAAWITFMTGKLPGKHHVLDSEQFNCGDYSIRYNNSADVDSDTIWRIVSDQQRKVAALNVPMTYPPEQVNGIIIAGHNVPGPDSDYTYPSDFKKELLSHIPDYLNPLGLAGKSKHSRTFDDVVERALCTVDHYREATMLADSKLDWDLMMVVFPQTDVGHRLWPYMNPQTSHLWPQQRDRVSQIFSKLDDALGSLFALAERKSADVVIMSDHGHGTMAGHVRPNKLLEKWGYLKRMNPIKHLGKRIRWEYLKIFAGKNNRPFRGVDEKIGVDWSRTKAAVCLSPMWGLLYLNVKGRQPLGIVAPGAEYESLRDELIERFSSAKDPDTDTPLFKAVLKAETVYGQSKTPWNCPDLIVIPQDGMQVSRRTRQNWITKYIPPEKAPGTHLPKGLWMASGPRVKPGLEFEANIHDLAPTILALMNLDIPDDMDGRALTDIFRNPAQIRFSKASGKTSESRPDDVYSAQEEKQIEQRLADLGYVD